MEPFLLTSQKSSRLLLFLLLLLCVTFPLFSAAESHSCPAGWTLWDAGANLLCVKPQQTLVSPIEVPNVCARIFDLDPPVFSSGDGAADHFIAAAPLAVSVHSDAQNVWIRNLLRPFFESGRGDEAFTLGGSAGFGEIVWHDGSRSSGYARFEPQAKWQMHSGCIAMQSDGFWRLVDCKFPQRPFICAFVPPDIDRVNETSSSCAPIPLSTQMPLPETTLPPTSPPFSPPTRPPVPRPLPDCLSGWAAHGEKCYRLFADATEGGALGLSQQIAQERCAVYHPHASLTAILDAEENVFLSGLVKHWAANRHSGSASLTVLRAFVGGIFTSRGSVGLWYEDALWCNETDVAASAPSSPMWPTAKNKLFGAWGVGEPRLRFGCLAIVSDGTWRAEDCRVSLPYVCSYLNDGSTFPTTTTTESPNSNPESSGPGESDTTSTTAPVEPPCVDGWAHFAETHQCYRVLADRSVSAADIEQQCKSQLQNAAPPGTVRAAAIVSVEESVFLGRLVSAAGAMRALVGISYIERGAEGLYLDGTTEWIAPLAESLWAAGQPARDSGCVVVDQTGEWHYIPCGTPASAYVCVYSSGSVHRKSTEETELPTPEPVPTTEPEVPKNHTKRPLAERVQSLSGAVHLVVSAGTIGMYNVETTGGTLEGRLLMFAPDRSDVLGQTTWGPLDISPCGGFKKQEYIFGIMKGVVTVIHGNETTKGRVCVSDDGVHYVPTAITFEVVDATLEGLIALGPNASSSEIEEAPWEEEIQSDRYVGIPLRSDGALQLVVQRNTSTPDAKALLYGNAALIHHIRLSSSDNCMDSPYIFIAPDLPVLSMRAQPSHYIVSYQLADVFPFGNIPDRLHDADEETSATEFTVCVAVSKKRSGRSDTENHTQTSWTMQAGMENNEWNATTSYAADRQAVRIYTAVPGMRVYVIPPHVSVRGMWALPPFTQNRHAVVLPPGLASTERIVVQQYASPVIVLDGTGLREGMVLLLARRSGRSNRNGKEKSEEEEEEEEEEENFVCSRRQPTPSRDPTNPSMPLFLDTMMAISTAPLAGGKTRGSENQSHLAFVSLNLNHTGMWGSGFEETEETWQVCFAYTPLAAFRPLRNLRIVISRASISTITTQTGVTENLSSSDLSPLQMNVNVGFSGLLQLWGLGVEMWAPSTLSHTEITFARALPGNASISDPTFQCTNSALFYRSESLRIVIPRRDASASGPNAFPAENQTSSPATVVIPPGFFQKETSRRMRLCLSVPLPFHSDRRLFYPTAASVDVRPIEVHFIGPYAASSTGITDENLFTVVKVAENARDVIFPLSGYGLRDDMTLFLTKQRCLPRFAVENPDEDVESYMRRASRMQMPIMRPYDIPLNYRRAQQTSTTATADSFVFILNESHTSPDVADDVFGSAREPLFVCLYAPGTQREFYSLPFRFVVERPYISSIRVAGVFDPASVGTRSANRDGKTSANGTEVVYASFVDLLVEGFGMDERETVFIPAINCSDMKSFLWRSPIRVSSVPSMTRESDYHVTSTRYVSPQTSMSSWFLSLSQTHTSRFGTEEPVDNRVERFQWCVRYRDSNIINNKNSAKFDKNKMKKANGDNKNDKYSSQGVGSHVDERVDDSWAQGFVPTGISYNLVIPSTDGFLYGNTIVERITSQTRHPTLGMWEKVQLSGPLIDHTYALGNSLFMFLAEELVPCKKLKGYFVNNDSPDRFITAVNGSAVLLPKLLANKGRYKLCASAIYPDPNGSQEDTEAALQFFEIPNLRIELVNPVYAVFSLNGTDRVTIEQGQEWALPITGSSLSNMTLLRFRPFGAECSTLMPKGADDVIVRNVFPGLELFHTPHRVSASHGPTFSRTDSGDTNVGGGGSGKALEKHYVVLERDLIRALPSFTEYQLCFRPDRSQPWMSTSVVLHVVNHVRHPTHFEYFPTDGSRDVMHIKALPPTKVAFPWRTNEEDTANIVGAVEREVAVALWCLNGTSSTSSATTDNSHTLADGEKYGVDGLVSCGSQKRVMFVKPMDNDADPCFVDFEAVQSDIVRGPYVLNNGILTIPRSVSRHVNFYPNVSQPWVMCIETGPELWREPFTPLFLFQFTTPLPVGFRHEPDDPSNSSATLFPARASSSSWESFGEGSVSGSTYQSSGDPVSEERRGSNNDPVDRTATEGNSTLVLHVEDASRVFYLNGYAIQRGLKMRFGARCEEAVISASEASSSENQNQTTREALIADRQGLNNTLLYDAPLTIEDDHGVFLVPSSHFALLEAVTPMCLSTDDGVSYMRTNLSLTVLPSRLRHDVPENETQLAESIFSHTLVVPRYSKGSVSLAGMISAESHADSAAGRLFAVGTQVLFSSACYKDSESLPRIVVSAKNTITLTEGHTQHATSGKRLQICVRPPLPPSSAEKNHVEEELLDRERNTDAGSGVRNNGENNEAMMRGFRSSGLYFRVLDVTVKSLSLHEPIPNAVAESNGVRHLVVRRGNESMLLFATFDGDISNSSYDASTETKDNGAGPQQKMDERYLHFLGTPGALAFFGHAKFCLGKPCADINQRSPAASVVPYTSLTATFTENGVRVASADGSVARAFAVPLHAEDGETIEPWDSSTLCFSVDGGRHYLSVGVSYAAVSWAPKLRVEVSVEDDENLDEGEGTKKTSARRSREESKPMLSSVVHLFEQSSMYGRLVDARYDIRGYSGSPPFADTPLNRYLSAFTADVLWTGFLANAGYASGGELYIPAVMDEDHTAWNSRNDASPDSENGEIESELQFAANYRHRDIRTGMTMWVEPLGLRCIGPKSGTVFQHIHRQSTGWLLPIAESCNHGIQTGTVVRFVDPTLVNTCTNTTAVHHGFVFDAHIVSPREWMGDNSATHMTAAALQLPSSLRYIADGRYRLCVKKNLPYHAAERQGTESVYIDTPITFELSSELRVHELDGLFSGTLAVFQRAQAILAVRGSFVPFAQDVLRVAFTHGDARMKMETQCMALGTAVQVERTLDIEENHTHVDKANNMDDNSNGGSAVENKVNWYPVVDGVVHLSPDDVFAVSNRTSFAVCFSLDNGRTSHAAGEAPAFLRLVVRPPVLLGLAESMTITRSALHSPTAGTVSASALRLTRMFLKDDTVGNESSSVGGVRPTTFSDRPPSFRYFSAKCFVGNGIGPQSGRTANGTARALAVALLFTDVVGNVCDGVNLTSVIQASEAIHPSWGDYIDSPLAYPIFVIDARTGCLWGDNAEDESRGKTPYSDSAEELSQMHANWLNHTAALRRAGGIHAATLLARASTPNERNRRASTTYIPCVSLDGVQFYSANAPLDTDAECEKINARGLTAACASHSTHNYTNSSRISSNSTNNNNNSSSSGGSGGVKSCTGELDAKNRADHLCEAERLTVTAPRESAAPLRALSSVPLTLRVDLTPRGSYYVGDLAVVVMLMVRMRGDECYSSNQTNCSAFSETPALDGDTVRALSRFQLAVARELQIDPVNIILRLVQRGTILSPGADAAAVQMKQMPRATTYTLSFSLLSNVRVAGSSKGPPKPAAAVLLRYAELLRSGTAQTSLFGLLLSPATAAAMEVVVPYVNFTFGTGDDLTAALARHREELPQDPPDEKKWRERFARVPHATIAAAHVPDSPTNDTTYKASLWVVSLLLLFPVCLVGGSVFVYWKYMRYRPKQFSRE